MQAKNEATLSKHKNDTSRVNAKSLSGGRKEIEVDI